MAAIRGPDDTSLRAKFLKQQLTLPLRDILDEIGSVKWGAGITKTKPKRIFQSWVKYKNRHWKLHILIAWNYILEEDPKLVPENIKQFLELERQQ